MPTSKASALAKLTPEERKKVINLAAEMALLNHIKKLVDEMRAEATNQNSSSSDNRKEA